MFILCYYPYFYMCDLIYSIIADSQLREFVFNINCKQADTMTRILLMLAQQTHLQQAFQFPRLRPKGRIGKFERLEYTLTFFEYTISRTRTSKRNDIATKR